MKIQILGAGCAKCKKLSETTEKAAEELGLDCEIEKVTDVMKIMEYGVVSTPALVVDGKLLSAGAVPSPERIREMLAGVGQGR
ncbi:MAG: thioredoxin family protein [Aminobacteriaceae bacterium]